MPYISTEPSGIYGIPDMPGYKGSPPAMTPANLFFLLLAALDASCDISMDGDPVTHRNPTSRAYSPLIGFNLAYSISLN